MWGSQALFLEGLSRDKLRGAVTGDCTQGLRHRDLDARVKLLCDPIRTTQVLKRHSEVEPGHQTETPATPQPVAIPDRFCLQ